MSPPGERTAASGDLSPAGFLASLGAILAAAVATRVYRLGAWGLAGDELYTLRDSVDLNLHLLEEPVRFLLRRPLLFLLNHWLVAPRGELDALALRILPVVFGILGIAVLVLVGRRLVGDRAALAAGLLAVFNPWHLVHSQFARYYSLVFLLAAVAPAALYVGVRERSRGWTAAGVACAALGWLAHPTAILPTGGFLVWLGVLVLRRLEGRRRKAALWTLAVAAAAGVAGGALLLSDWMALGQEWGIGGVWVAVSWTSRIGIGVAVAAAAGVALLWLEGRRDLSLFLALAVGLPLAVVGILGRYVSVHTGYLFATAPCALLAAGAFLDRIAGAFRGRGARRVAAGAAAVALIGTTLPGFVSHYLDGSRPDFRGAARHVAERAAAADSVLTDQRFAFRHYAPAVASGVLERDPAALDSALARVRAAGPDASLWIVPYIHTQGGFDVRGLGRAEEWVRRHCELDARLGAHRLDHERNVVAVWRCPRPRPGASAEPAEPLPGD